MGSQRRCGRSGIGVVLAGVWWHRWSCWSGSGVMLTGVAGGWWLTELAGGESPGFNLLVQRVEVLAGADGRGRGEGRSYGFCRGGFLLSKMGG
jgi:hypothetical protein